MDQKDGKAYYQEAINRAIEYIESHTSENIHLEDIAEYACISKYHFHRIFKSIMGDTTKEYLVRLRLEKSAQLLRNSEKKIHEVAYECGYTSHETFTRAFKNYFSISPTLFRETAKEQTAQKHITYKNQSIASLNLSAPKILDKPDLNLAYIRHFGRYENVGKSFQQLITWAAKHLVLKLKPTTLGIIHDNPDLTADQYLRFDACLLVSKPIHPTGEIGYKQITGGKFAVFRYRGPYKELYKVYDYIYYCCLSEYQWELRDGPTLEWYIKSPLFNKPKQLVTDIYLPII